MTKLLESRHKLRLICISILSIVFVVTATSCLKRPHNTASYQRSNEQQSTVAISASQTKTARININTASANELEMLPGIGKSLAERIIEHREKFGAFRRPEHLIIVRGISDKRFRALRGLITVE